MGFINMVVRLGCRFSKVVVLDFGSQFPCAIEKIRKSSTYLSLTQNLSRTLTLNRILFLTLTLRLT